MHLNGPFLTRSFCVVCWNEWVTDSSLLLFCPDRLVQLSSPDWTACLDSLVLSCKLCLCAHTLRFVHATVKQWSNLWEKKVCSQIKRDLWGQSSIICLLFATGPLLLMNLIISWLLKAAVKSCFLPTAIWLRAPHISKCKRKKKQRIWKPQGSLIQGQTATNMRCSMSLSAVTCVFCTDFLYVTGPCALLYITT